MLGGLNPVLLALKMEEKGHELRNGGGLWKVREAGKWILPQNLQGVQPSQHCDFSTRRPVPDF